MDDLLFHTQPVFPNAKTKNENRNNRLNSGKNRVFRPKISIKPIIDPINGSAYAKPKTKYSGKNAP